MPIESFNITNVKMLGKAYCDKVPKLMVIAGPNGVGKSTLLNELRRFSDRVKGSGKILYVAPHRTWRRRSIRTTWLWAQEKDYSSILASDSLPGFEGVHIPDPSRRPDSADEAQGFIKYILAQIETRRQSAIVSQIDKNDLRYPSGYAPDVYKPLREMIEWLLPHLHFVGIDQRNRDDVKCILRVEGIPESIDIDDLSSGEKEVIALFMPLIEREIKAMLGRVERGEQLELDATPDTVMVIDEPDLHIHPMLQKRMIEYLRKRSYNDNVQFIVATHSPIIINDATSEELFVLINKSNAGNDNQVRRVVSSQEKLSLLKSVCGDMAILTLGRPIVFIEGKCPEEVRNAPSDQRILELLWKGARDFTFVPIGGRGEVEKITAILNQVITEKLIGFPVYAIVDADLSATITPSSSIFNWEFRMIENALLDPLSIFEVLEPYKEKAEILSSEDMEKELLAICEEMAQNETNERLAAVLPSFHLHFKGKSIEELNKERTEGIDKLRTYFTNQEVEKITEQIQKITEDTRNMLLDKTALSKFDGKLILGRFYQKRVSGKHIGMSFDVFCYSIAEKISKNGRTPKSIEETLTSIKNLFSREASGGSAG